LEWEEALAFRLRFYTRAIVVFGFSCPHPNPLPEGEGVAIPSPSGRGLGLLDDDDNIRKSFQLEYNSLKNK